MANEYIDPFQGMTAEERQVMADNIIRAEAILDTLTGSVVRHLLQTKNTCPLACIGEATKAVGDLSRDQAQILLIQALRRLATVQWQQAQ